MKSFSFKFIHWVLLLGIVIVAWNIGSNFARSPQVVSFLEGAETMESSEKKGMFSGWGKSGDSSSGGEGGNSSSGSNPFGDMGSKFNASSVGLSSGQPIDIDDTILQLNSLVVRDRSMMNLPATKAKYEEMLVKVDDYLTNQGLITAARARDMSLGNSVDILSKMYLSKIALGNLMQSVKKM